MATALVSALMKIPVRHDVAMTGEVTLRGRVLPIGGLKEKVLAEHRGGIKKVLIPAENEKDVREIPPAILRTVEIKPVAHMDDVLREALVLADPAGFLRAEEWPAEPESASAFLEPGEAPTDRIAP